MPINSFNFLVGDWKVRHRRLRNPLTGSSTWYEQEGTASSQLLFDGAISIDEMVFPMVGNRGLTLRLRNPVDDTWTIYWVNSTDNRLQPPVVGRWEQAFSVDDGDNWELNWIMHWTRT